jgi:hypothetical protein
MRREEDVEHVRKGDLFGIEGDSDRLGMAGVPAADLLVGGIDGRSAGVAAFDLLHPDDVEEHRFGAPEAAACQYCDLVHIRSPCLWPEIGMAALFWKVQACL